MDDLIRDIQSGWQRLWDFRANCALNASRRINQNREYMTTRPRHERMWWDRLISIGEAEMIKQANKIIADRTKRPDVPY